MGLIGKFAIAAAALLGVAVMQDKLPQKPVADNLVFDFNEGFATFSPETLRLMTFGFDRVASDFLWLRFLQHTPPKKIGPDQVSWIYLDLDAVTELDPYFYPAYEYGGLFISVITEDKKGAELILNKGIARFPDRWRLYAYLAYHYQFELNEPEKAGPLYIKAASLPTAPDLIKIIAGSLMAKEPDNRAGIKLLEQVQRESKNPEIRDRLKKKLDQIQRNRVK